METLSELQRENRELHDRKELLELRQENRDLKRQIQRLESGKPVKRSGERRMKYIDILGTTACVVVACSLVVVSYKILFS